MLELTTSLRPLVLLTQKQTRLASLFFRRCLKWHGIISELVDSLRRSIGADRASFDVCHRSHVRFLPMTDEMECVTEEFGGTLQEVDGGALFDECCLNYLDIE